MSVTVKQYRNGGWMVDINTRLSNGARHRERKRLSIGSKSAAQRWGQDRERHLLQHGPAQPKKEVPTLKEFAPRFLDGHARANRQKPSGIAAKQTILDVHLIPLLGHKRLDAITTEQVQHLKTCLKHRAPKTVNNVLTVLGVLIKKAIDWDVIDRMPCVIRLLPVPTPSMAFHDFEEYDRLTQAADRLERDIYLLVLLGGDAGLRLGEMMALEWGDVDLQNKQLCVERSDWKGNVTTTKGGRLRYVPMTKRLEAALKTRLSLRGKRVLVQSSGEPLTMKIVQSRVGQAARAAGVLPGVHILRHTFCSHLAMRGAQVTAIQKLAGHQDLKTTQRYMHLSPAASDHAIRLLDEPIPFFGRGNMMATGSTEIVNCAR